MSAAKTVPAIADAQHQEAEEEEEDDENTGETMIDMLNILKEYQNKKSFKSSSRAAALEAKKGVINDAFNNKSLQMKQEGTAYIKQVKARVQELKEKEIAPHSTFSHVAALFATHTKCVESQLDIIYQLISELSPVRLQLIEENSADVRSHAAKFAKTGRKIKRKAKNVLQGELEQQKLATEAQTYIAQYKHLVQL